MTTEKSSIATNSSAGSWCLIESDPGVFTELIQNMGVRGLFVEEIYRLEDNMSSELGKTYGLIFLFRVPKGIDRPSLYPQPPSCEYAKDRKSAENNPCGSFLEVESQNQVFFAEQVINNACATQAILSVLLNCPEEVDIGSELRQFKAFTQDFTPNLRGLALTNSELIRTVHNSFSRHEVGLHIDEAARQREEEAQEDAFHFVSYLPIHGYLYELDGLLSSPINHGPCTSENWLAHAQRVIMDRMNRYQQYQGEVISGPMKNESSTLNSSIPTDSSAKRKQSTGTGEIRFSLMAILQDRSELLHAEVKAVENELESLSSTEDGSAELTSRSQTLLARKHELQHQFLMHENQMRRYMKENRRRKHNFIPLIVQLLRAMAEHGQLETVMQNATSNPSIRTRSHP